MPVAANQSVNYSLSYKELDILHCLRGFCAFYVVAYHAKFILWSGGREYLTAFPRAGWAVWQYGAFGLDMLSSAGYEMVIFFFVLSGFFIRYAQRRKHRAPGAFYLNRIVRIYPPYLVSVFLAVGVLVVLARFVPELMTLAGHRELNTNLLTAWNELRTLTPLGIARTLVFLPLKSGVSLGYDSVYWSLLPEALFYAVVPLAFRCVRAYYLLSFLFYLLGVGAGFLHYDLGGMGGFLFTYNFYFSVGVALHDAVVGTGWVAWVERRSGWLLASLALGLSGLLLPAALLKLRVLSGPVAVLLAVLAVSALLAGRVGRQSLAVRIFHPIGIFSFTLYLCHFPLLLLCSGLLMALTNNIVTYERYYWLALPVVTLGCYALYWVTERISVNFFRKV